MSDLERDRDEWQRLAQQREEQLAAETHAREVAEAELREVAGALSEATALLERWLNEQDHDGIGTVGHATRAFLKSSRAPAQPAALSSAREQALRVQAEADAGLDVDREQPAAPEPSADNRDALLACARSWEPDVRLLGNVRACTIAKVCTDAETAEAKLATVQEVAENPYSLVHPLQALRRICAIVLTPAGPNGGTP
jgi:hypothetical protein